MNRRDLLSAVSAATLLSSSRALAKLPEKDESEAEPDVQIRYGVKIPMRDGVLLNAIVYLPKKMPKPRPAIFSHPLFCR